MHNELFAIAKKIGASCADCKEICCMSMALIIGREDIKPMAKRLRMTPYDFRKKYTVLLCNLFGKDGEGLIAESKEGKEILKKNLRLLQFKEVPLEEANMTPEQQKRHMENLKSEEKKRKPEEMEVLLCPFFDKEKRRCTIHSVRPKACRDYPFNYSDEYIDLRRINACEISTAILKRFQKFAQKTEVNTEPADTVLESGEFRNHFYLPPILFFGYIVAECKKLDIPITSPEIKKIENSIALYSLYKQNESRRKRK